MSIRTFLDLLYGEEPPEAFDAALAQALEATTGDEGAVLREQHALALRLREQFARQRQREAEMSALYETASDLTAIRDVDEILAAIVRRARQLLRADMTYLSLNDEEEGASYMRVTDGALTPEFRTLRLPLGTGLLGLVAQSGAPYYTDDYQADPRFVHRDYIDDAVAGEQIRAILGVPLVVEGTVIGALLAVHRQVRAFPPAEVALLTSFAAHAAVALENARLFQKTQAALAEVDEANRQIRAHSAAVETAASAHDRLTDVLLHGGGVADVSGVVADVLQGSLLVLDPGGAELAEAGGAGGAWRPPPGLDEAIAEARQTGRSVEVRRPDGPPVYAVAALAGPEHLGTLVLHGRREPLGLADRRTIERAALVMAVVLLFARSVAEAEDRVRGELLDDLVSGRDSDPQRLAERARRQRADLSRPSVLAVAEVEGLDRHRSGQVAARVADELRGLGGEHEGRAVVVLPGTDAIEAGELLRQRVEAAGGTATVGVTTAAPGPIAVAAAYREALDCAGTLLALGRTGEVSDAAGLGVARLVLGSSGPAELQAFVDRALGPVLDYDERRGTDLLTTLDAWFGCGGRPAETARALHIHPNTVAQRLDRVGRLLGEDWRDPRHALDLQLALRLHRLRARPETQPTPDS